MELQSYLGMWYPPFETEQSFLNPPQQQPEISALKKTSPGSFLSWNDDESSSLFFGARCKSLCHKTNGCCLYPPNTKANKFNTKISDIQYPARKKNCSRISPCFLYGLRSFQKRNYLENWGNKGLQAEPQGAAEAMSALVPPMDPSFSEHAGYGEPSVKKVSPFPVINHVGVILGHPTYSQLHKPGFEENSQFHPIIIPS